MADFLADTRIELDPDAPDRGRAVLSSEWAVWGPHGGYLAAIALRAAMTRSALPRPASFHAHFLAVGEFGPVDLRLARLGGGKRAESWRVEIVQKQRVLLAASVWMAADGLAGFEHDYSVAPEVPPPAELPAFDELADNYDEWFPIWRSMEGRPSRWNEPPGDPVSRVWLRFRDTKIEDREADALRQLFWLDFPGWNATIGAHGWPHRYFMPNLDIQVQFHEFAPECDYMLADGVVPVAGGGVIGCVSRLWSEDGRLLSTGTSQHICRPNPGFVEELERARAEGREPTAG